LRYTFEAASRDQAEIDPEGTRMAIVWAHRTFDPVAAADLLATHRERAKRAKGSAQ
jgi:hypothetical protein